MLVEPYVHGDDLVLRVVDSGVVADQAPDRDGQGYGLVVRNDLLDAAAFGAAMDGGGACRARGVIGIAGVRAHEATARCVDGAGTASQGV